MSFEDISLNSIHDWALARTRSRSFKVTHAAWMSEADKDLAAIDAAVERYLGGADRELVDSAIFKSWVTAPESASVVTKPAFTAKYRGLIAWLTAELDGKTPRRPAMETPSLIPVAAAREINKLADYVCSDVLTWPGNIKAGHRYRILNRYLLMTPEQGHFESVANTTCRSPMGHYSKIQLKLTAENIQKARSACCTSFAVTGAHLLGSMGVTARIEVVAVPGTHCLVLVGRVGTTIGPTTTIVDSWLGSLGHECFFTALDYPYPAWLTGLEQYFDSDTAGEARSPVNMMLGQRRTASKQKCPGCRSTDLAPYSGIDFPEGMKCQACHHVGKRSSFF